MASFEYEEGELPPVTAGTSYELGEDSNYPRRTITYYDVGNWSMSDLPEEDGNVEYAREAVLTWIAWYEHLKALKDNA